MKKSTQYMIWSAVISSAFAFSAACGGNGGGSGGNGDGDGDGDNGDGDNGDGDGDNGDGDKGDGDGDGDNGDGDNGDGDNGDGDNGDGDSGDGDGLGGNGGAMSMDCPEECPDDDNPCTEDACNPETGECGIPRTGNTCNDGIYCNGADTCEDGECSGHGGDPCEGDGLVCNEGSNGCECDSPEDCGEPFAQGDCSYTNECAIGSITVITSTCDNVNGANVCVGHPSSETAAELCPPQIAEGGACTNDANECNGSETCQSGSCSPTTATAPVCGGGTPVCRDGADTYTCVECTLNAHCGASEKCCRNECIPSGDSCLIVNPDIINPDVIINPQFVLN